MSKRRPHFRSLVVKLECDHVEHVATSHYRISESRAACIMGTAVRRGVWCAKCNALCQPTQYLGTARS